MSGRDDLPGHVAEASEEVQRAWIEAYDKFDKRCDGYTKVLLHPGAN